MESNNRYSNDNVDYCDWLDDEEEQRKLKILHEEERKLKRKMIKKFQDINGYSDEDVVNYNITFIERYMKNYKAHIKYEKKRRIMTKCCRIKYNIKYDYCNKCNRNLNRHIKKRCLNPNQLENINCECNYCYHIHYKNDSSYYKQMKCCGLMTYECKQCKPFASIEDEFIYEKRRKINRLYQCFKLNFFDFNKGYTDSETYNKFYNYYILKNNCQSELLWVLNK